MHQTDLLSHSLDISLSIPDKLNIFKRFLDTFIIVCLVACTSPIAQKALFSLKHCKSQKSKCVGRELSGQGFVAAYMDHRLVYISFSYMCVLAHTRLPKIGSMASALHSQENGRMLRQIQRPTISVQM